ncbi:hypothetical protein CK203_057620 [Vitis vinifera]|uniref:Uncharacterized protein n=1 Tax=Vitis vinifera TaxID=29760 RepID=A0A438GNJ2_VITVI|nr:hypothetical protein CK203_057620 [Vitis vinifera]
MLPEAVYDYDILMDIVIDVDGMTLLDALYRRDGHDKDRPYSLCSFTRRNGYDWYWLYSGCSPAQLRSALDMFRAFMLEIDDDDSVTVVTPDVITIEGASDSVDPPFSFDTKGKFKPSWSCRMLSKICLRRSCPG